LRRTDLDDATPTTQFQKTFARQWLGEQVRQLVTSPDVVRFDDAGADAVTDEVEPDVNVFAPLMEHRILSQRQC